MDEWLEAIKILRMFFRSSSERFYHDFITMEKRYQRRLNVYMISDYCWMLIRKNRYIEICKSFRRSIKNSKKTSCISKVWLINNFHLFLYYLWQKYLWFTYKNSQDLLNRSVWTNVRFITEKIGKLFKINLYSPA